MPCYLPSVKIHCSNPCFTPKHSESPGIRRLKKDKPFLSLLGAEARYITIVGLAVLGEDHALEAVIAKGKVLLSDVFAGRHLIHALLSHAILQPPRAGLPCLQLLSDTSTNHLLIAFVKCYHSGSVFEVLRVHLRHGSSCFNALMSK